MAVQFFSQLKFHYDDGLWPYIGQHAAEIAAFWQAEKAQKPSLFNGTVLVSRRLDDDDGLCRGVFQQTPYAAFLHYLRSGKADGSAKNSFAMAALCAADDVLVLAQMADHTANGGKIYFPAGTPDLDDVRDGMVNFDVSVRRELHEETGLHPQELQWGRGWWRIDGPLSHAFMAVARSPLAGDVLAALLVERMAKTDGELSNFISLRNSKAIDAQRMPPFVQRYVRWWFDEGGRFMDNHSAI